MKFEKLFLIIFILVVVCCKDEGKTNKGKQLAMYRVTCHEDEWVTKYEKSGKKIIESSVSKSDKYDYGAHNLFDGRKETCWCPEGDGIGEFVIFKIPFGIKGIKISNGLAASEELFKKNNRVKELYVGIIANTFYTQKSMEEYDLCGKHNFTLNNITDSYFKISLQDKPLPQEIVFNITRDYNGSPYQVWAFEGFKRSKQLYIVIGIDSVYKGDKYNNTCISEIEIIP